MAIFKATLQTAEYRLLCQSFKEWLRLLGYSPLSIPALTLRVNHFLRYQEGQGKICLAQLEPRDAGDFIGSVQENKNVSHGHVNKLVQALNLFSRYARETARNEIGFTLQRLPTITVPPVWLTPPEVQSLYDVTGDSVLGSRDRAMMAVFYGGGLRLNEGASLEMKDINRSSKWLHVRKGKHYKERLVPLATSNYEAIVFYIEHSRPQLLQQIKTDALFIDVNKGRPLGKQSLYLRIRQLAKRAKLQKRIGTHTLRHSIATHLLQSGMKLERIQQFLGHAHLDSTHLVNDML